MIGDPETDITGTYTDANDKTYAATAKVTITESDTGASARKSDGTGEAKGANGTVVKSGKVKDVEVVNTSGGDRTWRIWFVDDLGGQGANDLGFARPVGGSVFQGQFTQTVAVPETGAWTMMLLGCEASPSRAPKERRAVVRFLPSPDCLPLDLEPVVGAPFAQRLFRRGCFIVVPSVQRPDFDEEILEPAVGAFAEKILAIASAWSGRTSSAKLMTSRLPRSRSRGSGKAR